MLRSMTQLLPQDMAFRKYRSLEAALLLPDKRPGRRIARLWVGLWILRGRSKMEEAV